MRPETMPPSVPCSGRFDTITRTSDGSTYAFRGNMVIKLDNNGVAIAPGFPAEISSVFPGLPNDLDASVFWEDVGRTYFFKVRCRLPLTSASHDVFMYQLSQFLTFFVLTVL